MEMDVPARLDFDCPEGRFCAEFYEHHEVFKTAKGKTTKYIRLSFKIQSLSTEFRFKLVARNFPATLKNGGELVNMLEQWLGECFIEKHTNNRKFNFDSLNGLKADVQVHHINNDDYEKPFVCLDAVYPPGTLVKPDDSDKT